MSPSTMFAVGQRASVVVEITESLLDRFAELSGDHNPLHADVAFARRAGFQRRVTHGVLSLAFLSRLIGMELPGTGALWRSVQATWLAPVFPGDVISFDAVVKAVSVGHRTLVLALSAHNRATSAPVLRGEAVVGFGADEPASVPPPDSGRTSTPATTAPVAVGAKGRPILVTGGSRGLGRAVATRLAAAGHPVAVAYRTAEVEAAAVVDAIRAGGGTAVTIRCDLEIVEDAQRAVQQTRETFGACVGLVHCATSDLDRAPLAEVRADRLEGYFRLYATSVVAAAQAMLEDIRSARWGRVVLFGTSATVGVPPSGMLAYVTGKSAMVGLSKALAVELGPLGATVNVVLPGLTPTELTRHVSERARLAEAQRTPMRRLATPEDAAATVAFLISDDGGFITGGEIPVNGGMAMR